MSVSGQDICSGRLN